MEKGLRSVKQNRGCWSWTGLPGPSVPSVHLRGRQGLITHNDTSVQKPKEGLGFNRQSPYCSYRLGGRREECKHEAVWTEEVPTSEPEPCSVRTGRHYPRGPGHQAAPPPPPPPDQVEDELEKSRGRTLWDQQRACETSRCRNH